MLSALKLRNRPNRVGRLLDSKRSAAVYFTPTRHWSRPRAGDCGVAASLA